MDKFSKRLRDLREEKNLSMKDLGIAINVSDAAISNWENNINEPKISYLVAIAKYFGVTADYLLGSDGEINNE